MTFDSLHLTHTSSKTLLQKSCIMAVMVVVFFLQYYGFFGDQAFSVASPTVWNSLPESVRPAETLASFK